MRNTQLRREGNRMSNRYAGLGSYSDLVKTMMSSKRPPWPAAPPGEATRRALMEALAFAPSEPIARDVRIDARWERDGVAGEQVSWSVGYGPRTEAWLLRPAGVDRPLPGIVALHDHSAFKFSGKEKIADGPEPPPAWLEAFRNRYYGGRAYANALAREGFAVLVPDCFCWGSRRFDQETMLTEQNIARRLLEASPRPDLPPEVAFYNMAAIFHEHVVAKYCAVLGTTMSGIISFEDRVAANYLMSRPEVSPGGVGCIGLSGGGLRSALLNATSQNIRAAVIVGMMTTYAATINDKVCCHSWMLYPGQWAQVGEWPDVAACRAPLPLLVQYDVDDPLFTEPGMRAAHDRLCSHYASVNAQQDYEGQFFSGPHKFDLEMQEKAFAWLRARMAP